MCALLTSSSSFSSRLSQPSTPPSSSSFSSYNATDHSNITTFTALLGSILMSFSLPMIWYDLVPASFHQRASPSRRRGASTSTSLSLTVPFSCSLTCRTSTFLILYIFYLALTIALVTYDYLPLPLATTLRGCRYILFYTTIACVVLAYRVRRGFNHCHIGVSFFMHTSVECMSAFASPYTSMRHQELSTSSSRPWRYFVLSFDAIAPSPSFPHLHFHPRAHCDCGMSEIIGRSIVCLLRLGRKRQQSGVWIPTPHPHRRMGDTPPFEPLSTL
jgi:hypothetical protein